LLLEVLQLKERIVPATLQGTGYETLCRIDLLISALGERGFVLRRSRGGRWRNSDRVPFWGRLYVKFLLPTIRYLSLPGLNGVGNPLNSRGVRQLDTNSLGAEVLQSVWSGS